MTADSEGGDHTARRLRELLNLRDDGLITEEEFNAQRQRILAETFGPSQIEPTSEPAVSDPREADNGESTSPTDVTPDGRDSGADGDAISSPRRWPNWLRIMLVAVSGIWVLTVPFMFQRAARYTWLPYVGAVTLPLVAWALIASGLEDRTLEAACKTAEEVVSSELAGRDLDWNGDCDSESLEGYRWADIAGGHSIAGSADWTDSSAGYRKRTEFEVHVTEDSATVAMISTTTVSVDLQTICKRAEEAVSRMVAGRDLDWIGDCNRDRELGYRVAEIPEGHLFAGSVDWTDAAGSRMRTDFEVHVTERQAEVVTISVQTVRDAPTPTPTSTRTETPARARTPGPVRTPEPTPNVEECFSPWDGNLDALEDLLRPGLNDEGSMQTHETRFSREPDSDGYHLVRMEYSAQNSFGGRVKTVATGKVRASDCHVILTDPGY